MQPFRLPHSWPTSRNGAASRRLVERFVALGPGPASLAEDATGLALLSTLGGFSPYLSDLAVREAETLLSLARHGPNRVVVDAMADLAALAPGSRGLGVGLRVAKRRIALAVAVADIGGVWCLERVTGALSDLAEAALSLAIQHLMLEAGAACVSGITVLGMGKLGAGELNYSSDVDLVLIHDPESAAFRPSGVENGKRVVNPTRIARGLVALMEARDADGYVFRTDLRLRPDPAATPPCVALPAALAYYESMAQNWERAAMLKARPVAGDRAMGAAFLEAIRPFVWRRHLDFSAIADLQSVKKRIDARKHHPAALDPVEAIAARDLKLGPGGIREIEFLTQTLQLVWGGREPDLRERRTVPALRLLARAGHLPPRGAGELIAAYRFLRRVEHRLQMVADRQTHTLPEGAALDSVAGFLGFADIAGLARITVRHAERVRRWYARVFDAIPLAADTEPALDFSGPDVPPATLAGLAELGFEHPAAIADQVRGWRAGRARALRSERARLLLDELLPGLLRAISQQDHPDIAFARFDAMLSGLPAGVPLLSLLQRNPGLVGRIAAVLGTAGTLAEHLARSPAALEGLLMPRAAADPAALLAMRLADARALDDVIAITRGIVREEEFSIAVATLEGRLDADMAGGLRADLADAALAALLPEIEAHVAARHGFVPGGGIAVVLLGKAGGREMMAGSDLDLMLIYDHPAEVGQSDGGKPLAPSQYFIRVVHAFVAALTAPDALGGAYAVDMRLRPSGNKGPVAVSLAAFEAYHAAAGPAWTWERMALTRARVVAGPAWLRGRVQAAIGVALSSAGPQSVVLADAVAMRARMARELPPNGPWDVKLRPGGQIDVEFIAQALSLARRGPFHPTTRIALAGLQLTEAPQLIEADHLWRTVQGMLRLTDGRVPPSELSVASGHALRAVTGAIDLADLRTRLDNAAAGVRAVFQARLQAIADDRNRGAHATI